MAIAWFSTNDRPSPDTIYRLLNKHYYFATPSYVKEIEYDGCQAYGARAVVFFREDAISAEDVAAAFALNQKKICRPKTLHCIRCLIRTFGASHFIQWNNPRA